MDDRESREQFDRYRIALNALVRIALANEDRTATELREIANVSLMQLNPTFSQWRKV